MSDDQGPPSEDPPPGEGHRGDAGGGAGGDPLAELFRRMFGGSGPGQVDPSLFGGTLPTGFTADPAGGLPPLPPELAQFAAAQGLPTDPSSLGAMFAQVQRMIMTGDDGPVNWQLAHDLARQTASEEADPAVTDAGQRQVAEALRTADLWLDRVTDLPAATARSFAWSRADWVEQTLPTWRGVVEPVALSVGDAMADALAAQAPQEIRPMLAQAEPMLRRMGGAFFGAQLGRALGTLAREVVGGGDIGLPLLPAGQTALLPTNVAAFGQGLELPEDEVRLYLALREAAHARLVANVSWLRAHLLSAVEEYARGIAIDTDRIEAAIREVDPSDPEALQQALSSGLFEPETTPQQKAALHRLETALALVEGWIDVVVDGAARPTLPHAAALRETVVRRRATGGPAEHTFATLVGLELRPRRLREAAAVWAALGEQLGTAERDARWAHPDLVPTDEAFADPLDYAKRADDTVGDDLDAALTQILEEGRRDDPPPGGPT